jgi:hypothetical protein
VYIYTYIYYNFLYYIILYKITHIIYMQLSEVKVYLRTCAYVCVNECVSACVRA